MALPPAIAALLRGEPLDAGAIAALRQHHGAARFREEEVLGVGATATVRRVWDPALDRPVALKLQREAGAEAAEAFAREARILSRLDHPGILPVLEAGETVDGRVWFTLPVVRGEDFDARIAALHGGAEADGLWSIVSLFHRAAEAVAHAHRRGVIHRDLKPANLRVDGEGAVRVLDWGLAAVEGEAEPPDGALIGSPAWMAPEAAAGEEATPATDVFGLGAILFAILTGRPPYVAPTLGATLRLARAGAVGDLSTARFQSRGLVKLCRWSVQVDPADRPADAGRFAAALGAWLDGGRRSAEARALVRRAQDTVHSEQGLRARAEALEGAARRLLQAIPPWAPSADKEPGWALQDEARAAAEEADRLVHAQVEGLQAALRLDPELPEAHVALADLHRQEADRADLRGDRAAATRHSLLVAQHDRGQHRAWIDGTGALTVVTEPPGAEVFLSTFVEERRRLVPRPVGSLGRSPLHAVPLPPGSHLLTLRREGRVEVRYPVAIGRAEHWHGVAPGEAAPRPIYLPRPTELEPGEIYVPGGWTVHGGDPLAADPLPLRRVWVEPFCMDRYPVTWGDWLAFVRRRLATGDDVSELIPAEGMILEAGTASLCDMAGANSTGNDSPVGMVNLHQCRVFLAETGHRLLTSLEWEKAGRGVDGRPFVWGDSADPSWAVVLEHHPGRPQPLSVLATPEDCSLYGVCGLQGGVRTWCGDVWLQSPDAPVPEDPWFNVRGGAWNARQAISRLGSRFAARAGMTFMVLGLRRARDLGPCQT